MKIIDFHTHVYPDFIAPKAAGSIREFYGLGKRNMNGTVEMLLKKGEKAGISQYVILPVAIHPERTRHINEFILETVAKEPKFIGFGTVHAGTENLLEEVDFIAQKGLKGIKMHPDSQVFNIDHENLLPMYDYIQGKMPLVLHMGDPRYNYSHPARLKRILEMFPKLQVIAAHFGGYSMYEEAYQILKRTNCFFDVSSSLMFMKKGVAEHYINRCGAERFVYGSDYPMWNPVQEKRRFMRLKLTDEQFEQIAHKTAEHILGLK